MSAHCRFALAIRHEASIVLLYFQKKKKRASLHSVGFRGRFLCQRFPLAKNQGSEREQ